MMKVTGKVFVGQQLDIKWLYLPGITLSSRCPRCGAMCEHNLRYYPLAYPTVNEVSVYHFYCTLCANNEAEDAKPSEWSEQMILRLTLEAVLPVGPT